jgi:hypothetical protein
MKNELKAQAQALRWRIGIMAAALLAGLAGCAQMTPASSAPPAVVEQLLVRERQPAFGGTAFGNAGPYERVVAQAEVALDPAHPANRGIVDAAAAASADGKVRYKTDVVILRPRDSTRASGTWVVEVANRGRKLMLEIVNGGGLQADRAEEAGTGWLMRQGHTLLWVGWQGDIPADPTGKTVGMVLPIATQGGQPITGAAFEEIVFDAPGPRGTLPLSYPAASLDPSLGELSVRARPEAAPTVIGATQWRYKDAKAIEFDRPAGFDAGAIYQFRYTARDPRPMGLGMAALRDVVSHPGPPWRSASRNRGAFCATGCGRASTPGRAASAYSTAWSRPSPARARPTPTCAGPSPAATRASTRTTSSMAISFRSAMPRQPIR